MAVVIQDKVGRMCRNQFPDVATIQDALNRVPPDQGGTPPHKKLPTNGNCGNQTIEAIQLFQLKQFGWPGADGKIFPGGETILRLNLLLSNGVQIPGLPGTEPQVETEPTTEAFTIRMSTGGIEENVIAERNTLFLLIEDVANRITAIYRVQSWWAKKEPPPPLAKFGLPETMSWAEPVSVTAFENAGFHYISRVVSTRTPSGGPDAGANNTMVIHLHPNQGSSEKQWFLMRRNTIYEAWLPAFQAAQDEKYGVWFEKRIEGRIKRVG